LKHILIVVGLICGIAKQTAAQQNIILTVDEFIAKIKLHHPLAKVAGIQVDKAKANLLSAKGAFDPVFMQDYSRKTFDGKNYYNYSQTEIKAPLPIGDFKAGIEKNNGLFTSDELTLGRSSYAGFELPLAKGLFIDKRRAFLQQAKIAVTQSEQQRLVLLNDVLLDAYIGYYQWAASYDLYQIYSGYLQVSRQRFGLVKIAQKNGDRSGMDTTEALTQVQNFELLQTAALMQVNDARFVLDNFIWDESNNPQALSKAVIPDSSFDNYQPLISKTNYASLVNSAANTPLLNFSALKIKQLEIDQKLKYQNLLPMVNLKANLLNRDYNVLKNIGGNLFDNNYNFGFQVKIPIFLREGRGEYRAAKLKVTEERFMLKQKVLEVNNKINIYANEFEFLQTQLKIANSTLVNFQSLLRNELLRFNAGESSLFLVNSRENKVLEMQQKVIELQVKLFKSKYSLDWAAGTIQ
jgi:outer membrane protein TolC